MKTNLQRAAVVLLVIAGLTALIGSKAFKLHADSQVCTNAILRGGYGAGTTGLINSSSNPNDVTIPTFVPFVEAVHFVFDGPKIMEVRSARQAWGGFHRSSICPNLFLVTDTAECADNRDEETGEESCE